jgi:hypothetical protein
MLKLNTSLKKITKNIIFIAIQLIIIASSYLASYFIQARNNFSPSEEIRYLIKNSSNQKVTKVSIKSKIGDSVYSVQIEPAETIKIYTYTKGEDAPELKLELENGTIIVGSTYVEAGSGVMVNITKEAKMSYCFSDWSSCSN